MPGIRLLGVASGLGAKVAITIAMDGLGRNRLAQLADRVQYEANQFRRDQNYEPHGARSYLVPVSKGAISRYFNALREIPNSEDFPDSGGNTRNPKTFGTPLLDDI